jgi:hypothetical protein
MKEPDYIRAHEASSYHREQLMASDICGCFYCLRTFAPDTISVWVTHGQTALCPKCGIDSVLGSASGYPISESFLRDMQKYWF